MSPGTPRPRLRVVRVGDLAPTGHLVCEGCGRILRWEVPAETQSELTQLASSSPEGWEVRALAVSFTGSCPNCQRAPARDPPG